MSPTISEFFGNVSGRSINFAKADPKGFLAQYDTKVILDEIQRVPDLPSYLQPLIDKTKRAVLNVPRYDEVIFRGRLALFDKCSSLRGKELCKEPGKELF